jgi:hypothetical protein
MTSKTFGEMTPAERRAATERAVGRFQAELDATAPEIGRILDEAEPYDQLDAMIAFEQGELDEEGIVVLFQHLVDNGQAWQLQGFYGRTARDLIEAGLVRPAGASEEAQR